MIGLRIRALGAVLLATGVWGFAGVELDAGPTKKAASERAAAEECVQQALAAELAGDLGRRSAHLSAARDIDPEFAQARWQRGEVFFDGQWRNLGEIGDLVATDRRWKTYRRLRRSMGQTPSEHQMLARWCRRNRLANEERYHWMHVLAANPNHEEAQRRLGVREYRGDLYSYGQVAEFKQQAKASKKNLAHFKPIFLKVRQEVRNGSPTERAAALERIRAVSNPEAIEALEAVLLFNPRQARRIVAGKNKDHTRQLALDLNLACIAAFENMPEFAATVQLVRCAVVAPFDAVRHEAAKALKPREATSYVPLLMSGLAAPIVADAHVVVSHDGSAAVFEELSQAGFDTDRKIQNISNYTTRWMSPARSISQRIDGSRLRQNETDRRRATQRMALTSAQVYAANRRAWQTNERIGQVLETTTGFVLGSDPESWWKAWQEYNELYYPEDKPVYQTYHYEHRYREMPGPPPSRSPSCFVAGTPVWTPRGPIAIEAIRVGDMVLSQDPASAELAFKPVLKTTTRPPTPTLHIVLSTETVTATRGHRFWSTGYGWRMAKFLMPGSRLRSLDGSVEIESIDEGQEVEAYNLAVGEFNTYFVGDRCLLVHDNSCPRPTSAPIPGMAPLSVTEDPVEN